MLHHSLTNSKIHKYYQNKPKFNGAYSKNSSTTLKEEAYVINFDECKSIGTHWIVLFVNG